MLKVSYCIHLDTKYDVKLNCRNDIDLYDFAIPFRLLHVCRSFSMQRMYEDDFAVRNQRDRLFQVLS